MIHSCRTRASETARTTATRSVRPNSSNSRRLWRSCAACLKVVDCMRMETGEPYRPFICHRGTAPSAETLNVSACPRETLGNAGRGVSDPGAVCITRAQSRSATPRARRSPTTSIGTPCSGSTTGTRMTPTMGKMMTGTTKRLRIRSFLHADPLFRCGSRAASRLETPALAAPLAHHRDPPGRTDIRRRRHRRPSPRAPLRTKPWR